MRQSSILLSIIIVNYNTKELTKKCIISVINETKNYDSEIIVIDNASSDGSKSALKQKFRNAVRLVESKFNLGFSVGNNTAAQYAKGEYLLLLNPDTVVLEGAIDQLVQFAQKYPEARIWGGRTLFEDGSLNPGSCWAKQSIWSLVSQLFGLSSLFRKSSFFNPEGIGGWNRQGKRNVDIVSGCFFLIRRDFWEQLNGFNSEYFMYGEEADMCLRAIQRGARPMVTSTATIIHHGGASEKKQADKMVRLLKAKTLLIKHHFPANKKRLGILLLSGWPLTRSLAHSAASLLGIKKSIEAREIWKEVWARRTEWLSS